MLNLLFLLTIHCTLSTVWCDCPNKFKVTLYDHKNHQGESQLIDDTKCININAKLSKKASSLEMETGCVMVFKEADCKTYMETFSTDVNVGYPNQKNFKGWTLQDAISSVGPCSCSDNFKVEVYEHKDYNGEKKVIEGNKCQDLDAKLNDKVSSIKAISGCAAVYGDPGCKLFLQRYSNDPNRALVSDSNFKGHSVQDTISSVGPCRSNK